jgi:hypothetical protein
VSAINGNTSAMIMVKYRDIFRYLSVKIIKITQQETSAR